MNILTPVSITPARFYLLPKIHKSNNPGRPVISSTNCHTTKLSRFVDHYIQPLAIKIKSYIRDTTDFLNKIKNIGTIPEKALLVSMDVRALYSNIEHNEGLLSLEEALNNRTIKEPKTEVITTLMKHILTLNNFRFNNKHYLQIKGCAMGTVAAPSYANIFMGSFEEKFIYPAISNDCLFYARYIDDIFLIYTGDECKLEEFFRNINRVHDSIKFEYVKSSVSIAFLDTLIYIDDDRKLQTTLYNKPTDSHNYLHYNSAHPRHLRYNLPYSQALRIRRICSEADELDKQNQSLTKHFRKRNYPSDLITSQITKASSITREETLALSHRETNDRIPLITTFHTNLPPLARIINNRWDLLRLKPHLSEIFQDTPVIAYRRPPNIQDMVSSNTIENNMVSHKNNKHSLTKSAKFCQPCNRRNSQCCKHIRHTDTFTSFTTNSTYRIYHNTDCSSSNIIYLLECSKCKIQYIGKSESKFNLRINIYRHKITSPNPSNLLPVEQHFRAQDHDFNVDAKFTIIEKLEKNTLPNKSKILELHEDFWIKKLKTLAPHGLNTKLNHPDRTWIQP